jgi:hypothetical protein
VRGGLTACACRKLPPTPRPNLAKSLLRLNPRPDAPEMLTQLWAFDGLFHTATGTAYADLLVDGHRETWPIRSRQFRGCLRRRYYEASGSAMSGSAIRSEVDLLEARAQFDAPERAVHLRVAEHAGCIYPDLADAQWRVIEISTDGWRLNGRPPIRFNGEPACYRCRSRSGADRSKPSCRFSTSPVGAIACWW